MCWGGVYIKINKTNYIENGFNRNKKQNKKTEKQEKIKKGKYYQEMDFNPWPNDYSTRALTTVPIHMLQLDNCFVFVRPICYGSFLQEKKKISIT